MIYIDPPYNTQNNFSYDDKKSKNDWGEFLKARLELAFNYLSSSGVIFISIDDSEYAELKLICDSIFGRNNFLGTIITHQSQRSNAKFINIVHEYVICYAKDKTKTKSFKIKRMDVPADARMITDILDTIKKVFKEDGKRRAEQKLKELIDDYCESKDITWLKNYSNVDEEGNVYFAKDLSTPGTPREVDIPEIGIRLDPLKSRGWSSDSKIKELFKSGKIVFKNGRPYAKHLLIDAEDNICSIQNFYSRQGRHDLQRLGLDNIFDTPKPVELIKFLVRVSTPSDGLILDFFAGSGTTAQAVYEINKEDVTDRHYILAQRAEKMNQKSAPYRVCRDLGIKPIVSEAMRFRIEKYLETSGQTKDFDWIELGGEK